MSGDATRTRAAAWLAWSLCALCVLLVGAWGVLVAGHYSTVVGRHRLGLSHQGALIALTFPTVGALIASSRRSNAIGWIFIAIGISAAGWAVNEIYGAAHPDSAWNHWIQSWIWVPAWFLMITFLPLLFPDGKLPSTRWRPVAWLSGLCIALPMLAAMLHPNQTGQRGYLNPLVDLSGTSAVFVLDVAAIAGMVMWVIAAVASIAALMIRFRGSGREQREQIKWVAFAGLATLALSLGRSVLATSFLLQAMGVMSIPLMPIATGVAVFRYRLYDIDRIIRRTLVYGALTVLLALVYLGGVVGVGGALRSVTGQESNNLAVAASTLVVAALFGPARTGIQGIIDRRFYRHRYDATRTLEAFSARLRDEVELDAVTTDLLDVVRDTVQPTRASLWLRSP